MTPINLSAWVEEHRHLLKPPVGNKLIWENREFMVFIVGGPNTRSDYHINQGEEFFYQIEGEIELRIIAEGKPEGIKIKAGEIFLLPPRVPHSPQRPANTVGLVLERKRHPNELDGFVWFCDQCGERLHQENVLVTDIVKDLPPVFQKFFSDPALCTCKKCGHRLTP